MFRSHSYNRHTPNVMLLNLYFHNDATALAILVNSTISSSPQFWLAKQCLRVLILSIVAVGYFTIYITPEYLNRDVLFCMGDECVFFLKVGASMGSWKWKIRLAWKQKALSNMPCDSALGMRWFTDFQYNRTFVILSSYPLLLTATWSYKIYNK